MLKGLTPRAQLELYVSYTWVKNVSYTWVILMFYLSKATITYSIPYLVII